METPDVLALDTETTGVDFRHGARPYFVTTCVAGKDPLYWEWRVDPYTRDPIIPPGDLEEVADLVQSAPGLVLHNGKFDVTALSTVAPRLAQRWPWDRNHDTIIAAHLLTSNRPKDLSSMAVEYLGVNIEPYEQRMELACKAARKVAKRHLPEWHIAEYGNPDMPSCPKAPKNKKERGDDKDSAWKYDTWLPRAVLHELGPDRLAELVGEDCLWWETVTAEYANTDSVVTALIFRAVWEEMRRRNLLKIYETRRKLIRVSYQIERHGVTVNQAHLEELKHEYAAERDKAEAECVGIAAAKGYELKLPKGAVNDNLREFCFDVLQLEHIKNPKAKTDAPTLDTKNAIPHYLVTLQPGSPELNFIKALTAKRTRDTALNFISAYERFWVPRIPGYYRLHPKLNITGTDTLRFSSSDPNEQNISKKGIDVKCRACGGSGIAEDEIHDCPRCKGEGTEAMNLRYAFGPEPGRVWVSIDARGIEDRLPAYKSKQQELIEIFERPDDPPYYGSNHLLRFHTVYPDIWAEVEKEVGFAKVGPTCKKRFGATWYQYCKNGGFAVQYGAVEKANGWGTADRAFHKQWSHKLLKQRFSKLEALNQWCIRQANKHGYVETMPDKTVDPDRGYPLLCTRTEYGKILETVPLNYYIQGTAMWWMCKAMIRVQEFYDYLNAGGTFAGRKWPGGYFIAMQVHDELVSDMPGGNMTAEYNLPVIREVARLMALGGDDIGIPTPVSAEFHVSNWAEGQTLVV